MTYSINKETLYDLVDSEVSQAADEAYGDNGVSLYDAVVLTSKDEDMVKGYIDDAIALLLRQLYDLASISSSTLTITAPDMPSANEAEIQSEIGRYIVMRAAADVFQTRRAALVPQYTTRAQEALDNIIALARTRNAPARSTT